VLVDAAPPIASVDAAPEDAGPRQKIVVSVCLSIVRTPRITFAARDLTFQQAVVEEIAKIILANPQLAHIELEGHTDPSEQLIVGQQRADVVAAEFIRLGVDPSRLVTTNAGSSKPIVPDINDANRAKNRRVELIIR
jgi:outer membrane protein OmpA-like peptidoglycan-associated protein